MQEITNLNTKLQCSDQSFSAARWPKALDKSFKTKNSSRVSNVRQFGTKQRKCQKRWGIPFPTQAGHFILLSVKVTQDTLCQDLWLWGWCKWIEGQNRDHGLCFKSNDKKIWHYRCKTLTAVIYGHNWPQILLHHWAFKGNLQKLLNIILMASLQRQYFDKSSHKLLQHHYVLLIMLTSCIVCCLGLKLYLWRATTQPSLSVKKIKSWLMH